MFPKLIIWFSHLGSDALHNVHIRINYTKFERVYAIQLLVVQTNARLMWKNILSKHAKLCKYIIILDKAWEMCINHHRWHCIILSHVHTSYTVNMYGDTFQRNLKIPVFVLKNVFVVSVVHHSRIIWSPLWLADEYCEKYKQIREWHIYVQILNLQYTKINTWNHRLTYSIFKT